ncbi:MAG: Crp/Fnr family transcriptional regulator [Vicinamibacterales bacterium]
MGTRANTSRSRNLLLDALPVQDYESLRHKLEIISLEPKQVLHNPGEPSAYVYFPRGGFLSMVVVLKNGAMVEVATVGREGMAVASPRGPGRVAATNTLVVVQGFTESCYRMSSDDFNDEMDRCQAFMQLMTRYADAFLGVVMQATGCNAAHTVEQRLCKWLLMAEDRMEAAEFSLTQEFVAMMLGATRQTVTVVAGAIQRKGLITYHRGRVKIVDRAGLEAASCECYRVSARLLRDAVTPLPKARSARAK